MNAANPIEAEEVRIFRDMLGRYIEAEIAPHYEQWERDEIIPEARGHFLDSRKWYKRNLYLGLPATLLAAVAGVTAFSEMHVAITGTVAMVVAALTAISTFLNPADRATSHRLANVTFSEIRRNANLLRDVDAELTDATDSDAVKALVENLKDLTAKLSQTQQSAPTLSTSALKTAKAEVA